MGLRTKILLLSTVVFAALAFTGYFGLSTTLLPPDSTRLFAADSGMSGELLQETNPGAKPGG
ncbi:MAG: hypothetical protein QNI98_02025 [Woeseiaceae bacterium]|nr:hypothetical protein [Woeseiaceae bacterium]